MQAARTIPRATQLDDEPHVNAKLVLQKTWDPTTLTWKDGRVDANGKVWYLRLGLWYTRTVGDAVKRNLEPAFEEAARPEKKFREWEEEDTDAYFYGWF